MQNYFLSNAKWLAKQEDFRYLLGAPTTPKQLELQLKDLASHVFDGYAKPDVLTTEFCLNKIALHSPATQCEKIAREYFAKTWERFVELKQRFAGLKCGIPSNANGTRLMQIANMVQKCSHGCANTQQTASLINDIFMLAQQEKNFLENALELAKINYYCASVFYLWENGTGAEKRLATLLNKNLLEWETVPNVVYMQTQLEGATHVVNCLGESAFALNNTPTHVRQSLAVYACKRNVFDTFCAHVFGNRTARFCSSTRQIGITMQYFALNDSYFRKIAFTNKGKTKTFTFEIPFEYSGNGKVEYFETNNSVCMGINGATSYFVALAVLYKNSLIELSFDGRSVVFDYTVGENETFLFDIVTLSGENMPCLADRIARLESFGATACPYLYDKKSESTQSGYKLQLSPCSNLFKNNDTCCHNMFNFTNQVEGESVSLLVDGQGKSATLVNGFAFGIGGEKLFALSHGKLTNLLKNGNLCGNALTYKVSEKSNVFTTNVTVADNKTTDITMQNKARVLALFPLEETSQITKRGNVFTIQSKLRKLQIAFDGTIESYTTNVFECNTNRLRYKFSNTVGSGKIIAVCLAPSTKATLRISSCTATPKPEPVVKESLVSTCLNYVNGKNVFNFKNFLKRPEPLSVASLAYTNPDFLREFLFTVADGYCYYYNGSGKLQRHYNPLVFALGVVYYTKLTGDNCFESFFGSIGNTLCTNFNGTANCIKALALYKMAGINGFDKMKALCEYQNVKKQIISDKKLYGYAQAIGAVEIMAPSKERLKDLCHTYNVPKSFYYVSTLENLYGIAINGDSLNVLPSVTEKTTLEQLALCVCGKNFDTTFAKSSVKNMTLNGVTYFQPFRPSTLKQQKNTLVVGYK